MRIFTYSIIDTLASPETVVAEHVARHEAARRLLERSAPLKHFRVVCWNQRETGDNGAPAIRWSKAGDAFLQDLYEVTVSVTAADFPILALLEATQEALALTRFERYDVYQENSDEDLMRAFYQAKAQAALARVRLEVAIECVEDTCGLYDSAAEQLLRELGDPDRADEMKAERIEGPPDGAF